jgi:hypothetical protein
MSKVEPVKNITGHCLCGGVRYKANAARRQVIRCHCEMCRRAVGNVWTATQALRGDLKVEDDGCLSWYQSSDHARRGFCNRCGASLFFDSSHRPTMGIAAATIDQPSGLEFSAHIYTDDATDYEPLSENVPSYADGRHGITYP